MTGLAIPFRQVVLKVHSRCDLACDHCYVFQHADQSWRGRPRVMPAETAARAAYRIAEHAAAHDVRRVQVVLHGGEPLLAGHRHLALIAAALRDRLDPVCELDLRIHTNGVRLDERFCDLFAAYGIKVGVSLDGDRAANDRHRRHADGRSSYDEVIRALGLLAARPELYAGILCTIDVANDPIAVYEALAALRPPRADLLLPHATWDSPPPRPSETAYADWLIAIFDRWRADGAPMPIRLFDSLIRTAHGRPSLSEAVGLEPSTVVVIETDGSYEQVDSLKVAYDGAPQTGFDVFRHSLDDVAGHPGIRARQRGAEALAEECRRCPVVSSCGGGLFTHRFGAGSFDHPSVYCADLFKLIHHIHRETPMPTSHALPRATVDALATGFGSAPELDRLAQSQLSLRRALLAAQRAQAPAAWDLLVSLDRDHPAALAEVLLHPYVRVWAVGRLRGEGDAAYLANIAAAAAIRAGAEVKIRVSVTAGSIHLPTLGSLDGVSGDDAVLLADASGVRVDGQETTWREAVRLTRGDFSVLLEDSDPHRDCHQWPASGRLRDEEIAQWRRAFEAAWDLIASDYPRYAPGLRAGLTTITPLMTAPSSRPVSSTARHAFGAVAAALPADPATLALLILHEFQHVKLGAVLDMYDLYDESDTTLYHAPWREDPRPLEGLLQGTYAHIAVSDFWRVRRHAVEGEARQEAQENFTRWWSHTAAAVETLTGSGKMTPLGMRFVSAMRETLAPWGDERALV
ncbi:uncharacterized protein HNP84_004603 [Thermocatellispora tengchongensis]|uniref:Radical SAM core domain-containing protein n=1 Tax=Thermocatellispora tengchongensis TaxID=1073253 RepID=A0A840P787_9ACTN|nr:FxsB family cyclophane-forming radical SAM/SPASM peptide maturase [Thermocatellispora tengchongensis]MBB5134869.1 uncharacterized protein [Thermocatellispora tengchongensis]